MEIGFFPAGFNPLWRFPFPWAQSLRRDEQFHYSGIGLKCQLSAPWGFIPLARFCPFLFCEKATLWPGSKGIARKKHRLEKNSSRRSDRVSAKEGGRIGARPAAPTSEYPCSWGKNGLPAQSKK